MAGDYFGMMRPNSGISDEVSSGASGEKPTSNFIHVASRTTFLGLVKLRPHFWLATARDCPQLEGIFVPCHMTSFIFEANGTESPTCGILLH